MHLQPSISKDRANAYVASVERKQDIEPRTGKKKKTTTRKTKKYLLEYLVSMALKSILTVLLEA